MGNTIVMIVDMHIENISSSSEDNQCMCVCCHPIYSGRQGCGRPSRGHTGGMSNRISPPFFCGACLNFSCEKDSAIPFLGSISYTSTAESDEGVA